VHQGVHELPDTRNHGEIANIGFIVGERCTAVIDSGGSPMQGLALREEVEKTTKVPFCYLINTHMHPDHIYGNLAFRRSGVEFIGHHKLARAMAMRAPYYQEKAARDLGLSLASKNFVPPDRSVEDSLVLDLGGRKLTLRAHGPAHTDNDLSIFDDRTQTLWLGDLLFLGHIPVIDGSLKGWLKELAQLQKIPAKRAIPGHGPVQSDWPGAAQAEIRYLENLREQVRDLIARHQTLEQALSATANSSPSDWKLFGEFNPRNVSGAYAEMEWEDP
jgi:quinoprotein relay system zinc metallohydrolase 2